MAAGREISLPGMVLAASTKRGAGWTGRVLCAAMSEGFVIPSAHLPKTTLPWSQRLAIIDNRRAVVRFYLAAIPHVTFVCIEPPESSLNGI